MKYLLSVPFLFSTSCFYILSNKDSTCLHCDTYYYDTSENQPRPSVMSVDWGENAVSVNFLFEAGSEDAEYYWGIAETNGDCLDSEEGCWTGEDCFRGFNTETGNLSYCHPISETGGSLVYGASPENVTEGADTVFSGDQFASIVTHIIHDRSFTEGPCWIWGADWWYYDDYEKNCIEM